MQSQWTLNFDLPYVIVDRFQQLLMEVGKILTGMEECVSKDEKSLMG